MYKATRESISAEVGLLAESKNDFVTELFLILPSSELVRLFRRVAYPKVSSKPWSAAKSEGVPAAKTAAYASFVALLKIGTARAQKDCAANCRQAGSRRSLQTAATELGWLQAMDKTLLVTLKGEGQIDTVLSSVQELVGPRPACCGN